MKSTELLPRRILVINVTRIGDTLAATAALRMIHLQWPNAEITVLGGPRRVDVVAHLPFVKQIGTITKSMAPFQGWLSKRSYDLAIVYNFDQALVRYALRVARHVVAYRQGNPDLDGKLYRSVDFSTAPITHLTDIGLNLLKPLGIEGTNGRILYHCQENELRKAREQLQQIGFLDQRPLIGLQVASFATKSYRDWPIENFLELCSRIQHQWPDARFVIFGGKDEVDRTNWLQAQLGSAACSFAGKLSLRETGAIMSLVDLYVGVDTGPTHLMSSFDIPIIGLYHSRHKAAILGPKDHPCNFSIDHPYPDDLDGQPRSMADISVETVLEQVTKGLATRNWHGH